MSAIDSAQSYADPVGTKPTWFTVEQANRALPLVRRIAADVVNQYAELERLQKQRSALLSQGRRSAAEKIKQQALLVIDRLKDLTGELRAIGCHLMDLQGGLVDFPGRRNSQEVFFCWKPGEPRVLYWHDLHAGFASRRPLDDACR